MNIAKSVKKTTRKATKALGLNCRQHNKAMKFVGNSIYDSLVIVESTIMLDCIYGAADLVVYGVSTAADKVKSAIASNKKTCKITLADAIVDSDDMTDDENEA